MQTIAILSTILIYILSATLFIASIFLGAEIKKGLKTNKPNYNFSNIHKVLNK